MHRKFNKTELIVMTKAAELFAETLALKSFELMK